MASRAPSVKENDDKLLTSAISKIAAFWGLSNVKLSSVLGLSEATISRLRSGKTFLDPASKSFEAGQFLVRLFRSLDALMGSDDDAAKSWLASHNLDLEARPIDLIDSFKGLLTVCDYVDAHRARV
ncbi:MbcA/ParS/Xre antitoxin family protein [Parasphingorhabdus sp.]|uniref:MbcA/ParS/Xre antitoxin family protein n=1 Tax=Parasphingorhabdus sp. TaxID=2709688 RepID=UPI003BB1CF0F